VAPPHGLAVPLPDDVRAAIYDVLGTAAAGGWRERELDELAQVLELDEAP